MLESRYSQSIEIYNSARFLAKSGKLNEARSLYVKSFYIRSFDENLFCDEYISFFANQFIKYLSLKPSLRVSVCEGDMVSDLIKDTYLSFTKELDSSIFIKSKESRDRLLNEVKIFFPCEIDTICM